MRTQLDYTPVLWHHLPLRFGGCGSLTLYQSGNWRRGRPKTHCQYPNKKLTFEYQLETRTALQFRSYVECGLCTTLVCSKLDLGWIIPTNVDLVSDKTYFHEVCIGKHCCSKDSLRFATWLREETWKHDLLRMVLTFL